VPPPAGVALAWLPKIAPMIFPKILIVRSQLKMDCPKARMALFVGSRRPTRIASET
jgi:hypothetical protein